MVGSEHSVDLQNYDALILVDLYKVNHNILLTQQLLMFYRMSVACLWLDLITSA